MQIFFFFVPEYLLMRKICKMIKSLFCAFLFLICFFQIHAQNELPRRAYWGINYEERDNSVVLSRITEGLSFEKGGALADDIVLNINGKDIKSINDFRQQIRNKNAGHHLVLTVLRNGKEQELQITADPFPYEKVEGVGFEYGSFVSSQGDHLRTIVSKPANRKGKLPAVLFIQWLSCDAIDAHPVYKDGNIQLIHDLSKAGYLVMRTEKPGVGDSKGKPCSDYGFNYELKIHQEALQQLQKRPDVDTENIFLFGSSMGGTMAPIIAQNQAIKGLMVTGCYYKTWYEHMLEIERRISFLSGDAPALTNQKMKQWSQFYNLYLHHKMTPQAILQKHPEYKDLWKDQPLHQYGRPVSFYMEANEHNIPQYWENISAPVLVIYGEYDWIMSREDHLMIAEAMNKKETGLGTFIEVPKASHGLQLYKNRQAAFDSYSPDLDPHLSEKLIRWINEVVEK